MVYRGYRGGDPPLASVIFGLFDPATTYFESPPARSLQRSTTANTIPNFVRGSVNLIMLCFGLLTSLSLGDAWSAFVVGSVFILLAFYSLSQLSETFGKDLDYFETE